MLGICNTYIEIGPIEQQTYKITRSSQLEVIFFKRRTTSREIISKRFTTAHGKVADIPISSYSNLFIRFK